MRRPRSVPVQPSVPPAHGADHRRRSMMALVSSAISAAVSRTPRLPRLRYAPGVPLRCGHRPASADLPSRCGPDTVHSAHAHHRTTRHSRCTPHALADLHAVLLHRSGVDGHRGRRRPSRGRFGAFWRLDWAHFKRFRGIWRVVEAGTVAGSRAGPRSRRLRGGSSGGADRLRSVRSCLALRREPHPLRAEVGAAQVAGPIPGRRPHQQFGPPARMRPRHRAVHVAPRFLDARRIDPPSRRRCRPQARPRIPPGPRGCIRPR